jgi:hypothetical protein
MTTATQETSENVKHYRLCLGRHDRRGLEPMSSAIASTETDPQKTSASISLQRSTHDDYKGKDVDFSDTEVLLQHCCERNFLSYKDDILWCQAKTAFLFW